MAMFPEGSDTSSRCIKPSCGGRLLGKEGMLTIDIHAAQISSVASHTTGHVGIPAGRGLQQREQDES
jgi:hypothetical protein